ncbi:MAG: sulfate adenylyltransferase small subunit [Actinomycetales bacterium mxb001]|nr:MAG: sulfate adenylyltransferase small subunit [Actinomycetales bacterium mxb001]
MSPVPAADAPVSADAVPDALEAEALWVMRETAGAFRNPVLMYSIGKDSTVLLHLARKAFYPAPIPFPLLHIDSTWEFQEMYAHRDRVVAELGAQLIVGTNEEGIAEGVTPLTHGVQEYTRIMRTVPLLQSLDAGRFDAAIGGGRRDEERSRAKERIFSLREPGHRWEPRKQRPEFWRTPNTSLNEGQTMRVFPISNWTELDVWRYIRREQIPVVDLYFAKEREVVERRGALLLLDDDRMPLEPGEVPMRRKVRFRTLGCYPLTAGVESDAETIDDLVYEMETTKISERAGRLIDGEKGDSMEAKKKFGYF